MNSKELKKLIASGEGLKLEFKKKANHPNRILNEVVAFANTEGGVLIIGVDDNSTITGIKFPEDDLQFLSHQFNTMIKPKLSFSSQMVKASEKVYVLVFKIKKGDRKPYAVMDSHKTSANKTVFIRIEDESIKASYQMRQILKLTKRKQGQTIHYGECESFVIKTVDKEKEISLNTLAKMNVYSKKQVSACLIKLVLAGVIKIVPGATQDLYKINPSRDQ